jgi:fumarate reductase subunit C
MNQNGLLQMKRSIFKGLLELLLAGLPAVLALDLLYLYFSGSWYDPIRWIELTEVVVLVILSLVYLGMFIFKMKTLYRSTPAAHPDKL